MAVPLFPTLPGIGWPVTRTQIWKTTISEAINGKETRVLLAPVPRYQYTLTFPLLRDKATAQEVQTLMGFFNSVSGSGQPFYYNDPNDFSTAQTGGPQTFGIGNGTGTAFSLIRSYGGYVEPIQSPVGINIYINGVYQQDTTYSLAGPGVIVFLSPPASGTFLTWIGTWNWLCRFDDDKTEFSQDMYGFWSCKKLAFTSVLI